ncbi:NRDE family protein, partial [Burkholderia multivorans]|uniref:NRDE family protein n=1 Tax=Burkholderia multivorans TaxID=87883 RepID=UPI000DB6FCD9
LGVSRDGRFAALTNYRAPFDIRAGAPTRGKLVSDYLGGPAVAPFPVADEQVEAVVDGRMLGGDWKRRELAWFCNRAPEGESRAAPPVAVAAGVHALSNARLDTPWP